jgi:hypothetical protein
MFFMAILALVLLLAIGVPIYLVLIGTATVLLLVEVLCGGSLLSEMLLDLEVLVPVVLFGDSALEAIHFSLMGAVAGLLLSDSWWTSKC